MNLQQVDFSKTLTDDQVYDCIMTNYSDLSKEWISHQWNWMNSVYWAFNDHYKYMIVISLVEKTLQFYDQMNIQYNMMNIILNLFKLKSLVFQNFVKN